jgi:hypothetical protein
MPSYGPPTLHRFCHFAYAAIVAVPDDPSLAYVLLRSPSATSAASYRRTSAA